MLQELVLAFYLSVAYDDIREGVFPISSDPADLRRYNYGTVSFDFPRGSGMYKPLQIAGLIALCYCVQRYFQDGLVFYAYKQAMLALGSKT